MNYTRNTFSNLDDNYFDFERWASNSANSLINILVTCEYNLDNSIDHNNNYYNKKRPPNNFNLFI